MKPRNLLTIVATIVCGFVCLLLAALIIHLALLSSDHFNWIETPKSKT